MCSSEMRGRLCCSQTPHFRYQSPLLVLAVALCALPPPVPHPLLCSGHLGSSPHAVYSIRPWMSPTSAPVSYLCLGLSSSAEAGPSLLLTLTVPACCSATPSLLVLTTPLLTAFLAAFHLRFRKPLVLSYLCILHIALKSPG